MAVEEKARERPGFYSAEHLQLNHYYTRSEAELAAKIGRGPNLVAKSPEYARKVRRTVANIEADEVEDRAALDYLARIGWEAHAHRADRLDLQEPAGAGAVPDLGGAAGGAAGSDLHRRRRVGAGDDGGGRGVRGGASRSCAVRHVWHEDEGFRKNAILNRAIATSEADFLVFIDGDVLMRPGLPRAAPGAGAAGPLVRRAA